MPTPRVAVSRWEEYPDQWIESYGQRLRDADLETIDFNEPGQTLEDCAGLVVSGGADIDPAYHQRYRSTLSARRFGGFGDAIGVRIRAD